MSAVLEPSLPLTCSPCLVFDYLSHPPLQDLFVDGLDAFEAKLIIDGIECRNLDVARHIIP